MIILFIIGLVVGVVSVVFVVQNVTIVTVTFFAYQLTGSLAFILSLAIGAGALIVVLFSLPQFLSHYFKYTKLKRENEKLTEDLRKQKELTVFNKQVPPTQEAIAKIEQGANDSGTL